MKIDWLQKLASRKFWAFLAAFISSLLLAFNLGENQVGQIVAIVTSFGSMAVYVFAEASVDKANAGGSDNDESF